MDLCLAIGCTLGELGSRMTSQEFAIWFARWCSEPWGDRRADYHVALMRDTIISWSGRTLKDGATFDTADLMPFRRREETPQQEEPLDHFRKML